MPQYFNVKVTMKDGKTKMVRSAVGGGGTMTPEQLVEHLKRHNVYPTATKIEVLGPPEVKATEPIDEAAADGAIKRK